MRTDMYRQPEVNGTANPAIIGCGWGMVWYYPGRPVRPGLENELNGTGDSQEILGMQRNPGIPGSMTMKRNPPFTCKIGEAIDPAGIRANLEMVIFQSLHQKGR